MSEERPVWLRKLLKDAAIVSKIDKAISDVFGKATGIDLVPSGMLGCGHFGCAFKIVNQPAWVAKITRDPTEGAMQAMIGQRQADGEYGFEGFSMVKGVFRLPGDLDYRGKKWPIHLIIREEVRPLRGIWLQAYRGGTQPVEDAYPPMTRGGLTSMINSLHDYKELSHKWHTIAEKMRRGVRVVGGQRSLDKIDADMQGPLNNISRYAPQMAETMGILQAEGSPLRDVHAGNIGLRVHKGAQDPLDPEAGLGYVVILDPGHTPSGEKIDKAAERIVNLNRGR